MQMALPGGEGGSAFTLEGPLPSSEWCKGAQPSVLGQLLLEPSKLLGIQIPRDGNWAFGVCLHPPSTGMLAKIAQAIKIPG